MWVLLSGEHETLPAAELVALARDPEQLATRIWSADREACERLAYGWNWMDGLLQSTDDLSGHQAAVAAIAKTTPLGTIAVRAQQVGRKSSRSDLQRLLGQALADAGWDVDLESPEQILQVWVSDGQLFVGFRRGRTNREDYELRTVNTRSHFQPVGLHPRLARCLVHLARVPIGGTIADPFCGTGGILMEAVLAGYDVVGSDIDPFMVQGSYQTLTDQAAEPLDATLFVADIAAVPAMLGTVDGIVADLPYGVASTTRNEELSKLYARCFQACKELLAPGAHAVLGCPDPQLLAPITNFCFEIVESHAQFVHKSLTRHFVVVKRNDGVTQL